MLRPKRTTILLLCLLAGGLYCAGTALWHMGRTAMFVHEAVAVTAKVGNMTKRPFTSPFEAMRYGNLPWDGDTAYCPQVTFTIPREPAPVTILQPVAVNDWDNRDYPTGEEVEVILPPTLPDLVHLNRFKFLWGGDCLLLLLGLALAAVGYLPLRRRKRRPAAAKRKTSRQAPTRKPAPKPQPRRQEVEEEEPFRLESTPPPPKKRRPRKPKDPNAPANPRKPRKKKTE